MTKEGKKQMRGGEHQHPEKRKNTTRVDGRSIAISDTHKQLIHQDSMVFFFRPYVTHMLRGSYGCLPPIDGERKEKNVNYFLVFTSPFCLLGNSFKKHDLRGNTENDVFPWELKEI